MPKERPHHRIRKPMEIQIFDDYHLLLADDRTAFTSFVNANMPTVFALHQRVGIADLLTEDEKAAALRLRTQFGKPGELLIYVMHGDVPIGWLIGVQEDPETFYMMNTGLLPAHQGKGVYTALLPKHLAYLQSLGYQKVSSRHIATHNGIIVPKLKAGFLITGLELSEEYGWLVNLTYYFNAARRAALMQRAGRG